MRVEGKENWKRNCERREQKMIENLPKSLLTFAFKTSPIQLKMSRPEHIAPPEIFYGDTEAQKYTAKSVFTLSIQPSAFFLLLTFLTSQPLSLSLSLLFTALEFKRFNRK